MRGGVVVSSGGAAFRDPRLFDRYKFTSLCTLVTTVPTERIPHPRAHPGRTAAPRQPATRPPAAPGADPDGHGAPPRIAAWRRALESPRPCLLSPGLDDSTGNSTGTRQATRQYSS